VIASLNGTVLSTLGGTAVIEVGGVGFSVQVTPDHALSMRIGEQVRVLTSLVVRDESLTLFGFTDADQLHVFELLMGVSGVGPKSAMGVLAVLSADRVAAAVAAEDDTAFRKVSGIGPKTAKLIVLSLTGKLISSRPDQPATTTGRRSSVPDGVVVALVGLGWPEKTAADAVRQVVADVPESERSAMPALLRLALAQLGPSAPAAAGER
jgi:Holliday junction DNA helicase RuvA